MDAGSSREPRRPRLMSTRCCIVGGGPAGMMLGYLLGARRGRCRRAGKARRLLPRFSRRHRAPLDLAGDGRTRPDRRLPETAAQTSCKRWRHVRRDAAADRRHQPLPAPNIHSSPSCRNGIFSISLRDKGSVIRAQGDDEHRGDRTYSGWRQRDRRAAQRRRTARSRSAPI